MFEGALSCSCVVFQTPHVALALVQSNEAPARCSYALWASGTLLLINVSDAAAAPPRSSNSVLGVVMPHNATSSVTGSEMRITIC